MIKTSYSSEISQLLKYVEEKFSDVLLPEGVVTKLDLIGKGMQSNYKCINTYMMIIYVQELLA